MLRFLTALLIISAISPLYSQQYLALHQSAVVADGHNDILYRVMSGGEMESRAEKGHSDLPRFREGGMDIQLFSIWVPSNKTGDDAWRFALDEIDSLKAIAARNPASMLLALRAEDIETAVSHGKLAAVVALEGGRCIDGKRDRILELYQRGMRCFGLTWNFSSDWATCSKDESEGKVKGGLSDKGKSFVRLLDSLGVIIDLSHLGERSFWDVAAISVHPLYASHSSCKVLRDHNRNLTDDQLRAVAKSNGVVMINYFPGFIVSNMNGKFIERQRVYEKRAAALKQKHAKRGPAYLKEYDKLVATAKKENLCTIYDVIAHIDHAVKIAGSEHVGLGSDFDGINLTPIGLNDVTDLPMITRILLQKGYSEAQIRGILGGNFLRLWHRTVKQ
ncbi:MAG: dipeptidase [Bacteroidota bacterium]